MYEDFGRIAMENGLKLVVTKNVTRADSRDYLPAALLEGSSTSQRVELSTDQPLVNKRV